jgi:hypothetical protein
MKVYSGISLGHKQLIQNVWKLKQNFFIAAFLIRVKLNIYITITPRFIFPWKSLKLNIQLSSSSNFRFRVLEAKNSRVSSVLTIEDKGLRFNQAVCVEFLFMPPSLVKYFYVDLHNSLSKNFQ